MSKLIQKNYTKVEISDYIGIHDSKYGLIVVLKKTGFGLINKEGKEIFPCKYNAIEILTKDFVRLSCNTGYGVYNINQEEIIPCRYEYITYSDGYFIINDYDDCLYMNINDRILKKSEYLDIIDIKDGIFTVSNHDKKVGCVNEKGEVVVDFKYDEISEFENGIATAIYKVANKHCLINISKNKTTDLKYDYISDFKDGIAVVGYKRNYGCINTEGDEVIPCKYKLIRRTKNGIFIARNSDDKEILINYKDEVLTDGEYTFIYNNFRDGLIEVKKDKKQGIINSNGKEIIPCKYDSIKLYSKDLIKIESEGKFGFININNEIIIEPKYEWIQGVKDDLILVESNKKSFFINNKEEKNESLDFDTIIGITEEIMIAKKNDNCFLINLD